jgi:predicted RNA-binding Zn ribbon-like protein
MGTSRTHFLAHGHGKTGPWVDLVNSEEWDTFGKLTDHLGNPAWLSYFLKQWRFATPPRASAPMENLQSLRSALRKSCEALSEGKSIASAELRVLNQALKITGKRQLFQRQNGLQLEFIPAASGWDLILAEIARSFAETLSTGENSRIKICRNSGCRWVFYDRTKGKTRCWCSDKTCGNRERVRRARAAHQRLVL